MRHRSSRGTKRRKEKKNKRPAHSKSTISCTLPSAGHVAAPPVLEPLHPLRLANDSHPHTTLQSLDQTIPPQRPNAKERSPHNKPLSLRDVKKDQRTFLCPLRDPFLNEGRHRCGKRKKERKRKKKIPKQDSGKEAARHGEKKNQKPRQLADPSSSLSSFSSRSNPARVFHHRAQTNPPTTKRSRTS